MRPPASASSTPRPASVLQSLSVGSWTDRMSVRRTTVESFGCQTAPAPARTPRPISCRSGSTCRGDRSSGPGSSASSRFRGTCSQDGEKVPSTSTGSCSLMRSASISPSRTSSPTRCGAGLALRRFRPAMRCSSEPFSKSSSSRSPVLALPSSAGRLWWRRPTVSRVSSTRMGQCSIVRRWGRLPLLWHAWNCAPD